MGLIAVPFPDCWGVDTDQRLTEEQYVKLWTYDLRMVSAACRRASPAAPVFPDFIGRYGPLYGNGVGNDLTAGELTVGAQTLQAAGRRGGIIMFQHVRAGAKVNGIDIGWIPTEQMGLEDAQTIVGYADAIGYSITYASDSDVGRVPHLIEDMENVKAGYYSLPMAQSWRDFVLAARRVQPAIYNGFNPGMSATQFGSLDVPICKDAGPRPPSPRAFVYGQYESVDIPGIGKFDIAHARPDATGATLVGIGWQAEAA